MAELPHLGKHCIVCKTLDFLPIKCFHCEKIFCKDHATALMHQCTPDIEIRKEQITRCGSKPEDYCQCTFCGAKTSILESIICVHCKLRHCLPHRHQADHDCHRNDESLKLAREKETEKLARQALIRSILDRINADNSTGGIVVKNRGAKNDALSARVAAMRLKSIARGQTSIPAEERLHYFVSFVANDLSSIGQQERSSNCRDSPVFLCKRWTIGRCVDWLAQHFSLINRNGESAQPKLTITTEARLRREASKSDDIISEDDKQDCLRNCCCSIDLPYICFAHELSDLAERSILPNAAKLILTYF